MSKRVYNFSAGPAVLPQSVLEEAHRDVLELPGLGMSILEISHRSKAFEAMLAEAEAAAHRAAGASRRATRSCSCRAARACSFRWCR